MKGASHMAREETVERPERLERPPTAKVMLTPEQREKQRRRRAENREKKTPAAISQRLASTSQRRKPTEKIDPEVQQQITASLQKVKSARLAQVPLGAGQPINSSTAA
jgi:hypothetical protein